MSPAPATDGATAAQPRQDPDWRPTAGRAALHARARLLAAVRRHFAASGALEVETPLIGRHAAVDPSLDSVAVRIAGGEGWLQTSPEYHMKRLLAAGSGDIWQLTRAVRDGEQGRWHQPEFTLLEWYRVGRDHHGLMDDVCALLAAAGVPGAGEAARSAYAALFAEHTGLEVAGATVAALRALCDERGIEAPPGLDRDGLLDLIMGVLIGPRLGRDAPHFVYDYPASQCALARLRAGRPPLASRFELYWRGVELANGFHELCDAAEQRARFEAENAARRQRGLPAVALDERLLAALQAGLPDCAGVALGIDRLLALLLDLDALAPALAFADG